LEKMFHAALLDSMIQNLTLANKADGGAATIPSAGEATLWREALK